jgi:hypothetical protein
MTNDGLEKARIRQRELREAGKLRVLNPLERAAQDPKSMRKAVNAKCYDCQGGDADYGVRERIRSCDVVRCPLNPVRPYQR